MYIISDFMIMFHIDIAGHINITFLCFMFPINLFQCKLILKEQIEQNLILMPELDDSEEEYEDQYQRQRREMVMRVRYEGEHN